jgi:hypothetical protein
MTQEVGSQNAKDRSECKNLGTLTTYFILPATLWPSNIVLGNFLELDDGGKVRPVCKADNLTAICEQII